MSNRTTTSSTRRRNVARATRHLARVGVTGAVALAAVGVLAPTGAVANYDPCIIDEQHPDGTWYCDPFFPDPCMYDPIWCFPVDSDGDDDGVLDVDDAFPTDPTEWADTDGDGIGDNTDEDIDGDGVLNAEDVFPADPSEWADTDGDGVGDNTDEDIDGDGVPNAEDAFPRNGSEARDNDLDGLGDDSEDDDDDNDGVFDWEDNCQLDANPSQEDNDGDGSTLLHFSRMLRPTVDGPAVHTGGDACDLDDDNDGVLDVDDAFPFDELRSTPAQVSRPSVPTPPVNPNLRSGVVSPNGTFDTDDQRDGATAQDRVEVAITTGATGGTISVETVEQGSQPRGWSLVGQALQIEAPAATAAAPLVMTFTLDRDAIGTRQPVLFRDGEAITATCQDETAALPDPCIAASARNADGDLQVTVRTSHASAWSFGEVDDACATVGRSSFTDVGRGVMHGAEIACVAGWGITSGVTDTQFAPQQQVTRGQMASFIARLLAASGVELPAVSSAFSDTRGSVHEEAIAQLQALGIVVGTDGDAFAPDVTVTRGQTASFLDRAWTLASGEALTSDGDAFSDDDTSVHQDAIDRLAAAGITTGTGADTFAPSAGVTREQMATFVARFLDRAVAAGVAVPPVS